VAGQKALLSSALHPHSTLRAFVKVGAGAIEPKHVILIVAAERSRIGDSIDLDRATRREYPQSHRWDYLLSVPSVPQIIALEPHSARDSEVKVVIAKKRRAVEYLRDHLPSKYRVARWFWVSRGPVNFSKMDPARRQLDQNGITFVGHMLKSLG